MSQNTNFNRQEELTIKDFNDETFVAFLDISGFKKLMIEDKAMDALNKFYQSGYDILEQEGRIDGLFVSDCGILFVRESTDKTNCLRSLLNVIGKINKDMLKHGFMLTTSIAYGSLCYKKKLLLENMSKNAIYGQAYVDAYLDSENENPKIQAGQCRIVKKNFPSDINLMSTPNFRFICERDQKHYMYYWSVSRPDEIQTLKASYGQPDNVKYDCIKDALNGNYTE